MKTALALLLGTFVWACSDDETASQAGTTTATSGSPTSSTAATTGSSSGGNGSGGNTSSSSTGSGGSIMMTPCNEAACDLTFEGTGFNDWDGENLVWGLTIQGDTSGDLKGQGSGPISGGTFSFTADNVLVKSENYNLGYFVDLGADMDCVSNRQPVWRLQLAPIQSHLHIIVTYDLENTTNLGCAGF